jgi:phosphate transport system substrate-binding protein
MRKISMLLVVVLTFSLILSGCSKDGGDTNGDDKSGKKVAEETRLIQVKGSDTMVNLGQSWAEEFMNEYQGAQLAVTGGGSGTGIAAIINGTADIAQSSRKMKDKEMDQAKDNGFELKEFVPGKDGIAIVVNKSNPIEKLTMAQLKDIYTGKVTNWKQVGGSNEEITVLSRESNSGTYQFFKEFVLKDEEFAQQSLLMPSTQAIVEGITQGTTGIGYIGLGYLNDKVKVINISKDENSQAYPASVENVKNGKYPVARELFIYTKGEPTGVVKQYVDFMFDKAGQDIVTELGFIPVK